MRFRDNVIRPGFFKGSFFAVDLLGLRLRRAVGQRSENVVDLLPLGKQDGNGLGPELLGLDYRLTHISACVAGQG